MFTKFRFPGVCVCVCGDFFLATKNKFSANLFIFSVWCVFFLNSFARFFLLPFIFYYSSTWVISLILKQKTPLKKQNVMWRSSKHRSTNLLLMKSKRKIPSVPWWAPSFLRLLLATTAAAAAALSPPLKKLWSLRRVAWPLTRYSDEITRTNGSRTPITRMIAPFFFFSPLF